MTYCAYVIDRMTGETVSRHKSYAAADKAATRRGERYAVKASSAYQIPSVTRQANFRARQAAAGKTEVRGIYATPDNAAKIKRYAARLK